MTIIRRWQQGAEPTMAITDSLVEQCVDAVLEHVQTNYDDWRIEMKRDVRAVLEAANRAAPTTCPECKGAGFVPSGATWGDATEYVACPECAIAASRAAPTAITDDEHLDEAIEHLKVRAGAIEKYGSGPTQRAYLKLAESHLRSVIANRAAPTTAITEEQVEAGAEQITDDDDIVFIGQPIRKRDLFVRSENQMSEIAEHDRISDLAAACVSAVLEACAVDCENVDGAIDRVIDVIKSSRAAAME